MSQDPGSGSPMSERMQSLLSRAVEDQLSEQRQLAGALTEVRTQLNRLGTQLESLQGGEPAGPQLDEALGAISGEVREAVRLLGERLDTLQQRSDALDSDLRELRQAFSGVAARAAQLPAREDIEEIVARAMSDTERRLSDHVDEAVLTLAEALLRRRTRSRATGFAVATEQQSEQAAGPVVPEEGEAEEDDAVEVDEYDEDVDDVEAQDEDEDGGDVDDVTAVADVEAEPVLAWQTPQPRTEQEPTAEDDEHSEPGKRKPWWRPGG